MTRDATIVDEGDPNAADIDIRKVLAARPMSRAQILGVATTLALTTTDGFDILAMSFAGPQLIREWHLTKASFGIIMAMNLIGIGIGSVLLSPLADRLGRRRVILWAMVMISIGMALTAAATTAFQLGAIRLITGLCIGGMIGPTLSLATEYANARSRMLTASIMSLGFPAGTTLGAITASSILNTHSWRMLFIAGALLTLAVAIAAFVTLPESIDFLAGQNDVSSRERLRRIVRRFGVTVPIHVEPSQATKVESSYAGLLAPAMRGTTAAMALMNFAMMGTIYFFLGWLPQIVADRGFDAATAASVSMCQNLGGMAGGLAMGMLARHWSPVRVMSLALVATATAVAFYGAIPARLDYLRLGATIEGFMALAASAGAYGILASAFPPQMRSTGIGLSMAFGRLGMVTATIAGGVLYTWGWSPIATGSLMAAGTLAAALILQLWHRSARL